VEALISGEQDLVANLANISAALREAFGFFWVGFYVVQGQELVLGPFQGPIACTRIAFGRGVCGTAWKEQKTQLVPDVEAFPGQAIGGGIEGKMDYHMDAAKRTKILQKLKEKGIKMVSYGVVNAKGDADWLQLFEFGKAMGLENFTSEPDVKDIPLISKLCDQFKINLAIHNHPQPSPYWNPDIVLSSIQGQSKRLGSCADIGHWVRSGLDPVESLKKLEGHVIQLHVKDLNEKNKKQAHDVHWGTGVSNIDGVIMELKRQRFKGLLSVEYEHNWYNNVPDVTESVNYFRRALK
jgi:sugar phosphate isomerase/epimerase